MHSAQLAQHCNKARIRKAEGLERHEIEWRRRRRRRRGRRLRPARRAAWDSACTLLASAARSTHSTQHTARLGGNRYRFSRLHRCIDRSNTLHPSVEQAEHWRHFVYAICEGIRSFSIGRFLAAICICHAIVTKYTMSYNENQSRRDKININNPRNLSDSKLYSQVSRNLIVGRAWKRGNGPYFVKMCDVLVGEVCAVFWQPLPWFISTACCVCLAICLFDSHPIFFLRPDHCPHSDTTSCSSCTNWNESAERR